QKLRTLHPPLVGDCLGEGAAGHGESPSRRSQEAFGVEHDAMTVRGGDGIGGLVEALHHLPKRLRMPCPTPWRAPPMPVSPVRGCAAAPGRAAPAGAFARASAATHGFSSPVPPLISGTRKPKGTMTLPMTAPAAPLASARRSGVTVGAASGPSTSIGVARLIRLRSLGSGVSTRASFSLARSTVPAPCTVTFAVSSSIASLVASPRLALKRATAQLISVSRSRAAQGSAD